MNNTTCFEADYLFAFKVDDIDRNGYISNGELFIVLEMTVGSNLNGQQLQHIVDKAIMEAGGDGDGRISFKILLLWSRTRISV